MKLSLIFLLMLCLIFGCSTDSDNDEPEPIFATPPIIIETETQPQPSEPVPIPEPQPIPEPEPIVEEPKPEPVPPHGGARDLVAPKLLKSSILFGAVDVSVDLEDVTLNFDETISKSDLKIVTKDNVNLKWTLFIKGKEVLLTKLDGKDLEVESPYSITGTVEDEHQNARVILITFITSAEGVDPEDNQSPRLIASTISHGDIGVNSDTDRFVFTFDEEIDAVILKLIDDNRKVDMEWTHFIQDERVIFLALDEGAPLTNGTVYTIEISWADKARNWSRPGIITFVTEIKE